MLVVVRIPTNDRDLLHTTTLRPKAVQMSGYLNEDFVSEDNASDKKSEDPLHRNRLVNHLKCQWVKPISQYLILLVFLGEK